MLRLRTAMHAGSALPNWRSPLRALVAAMVLFSLAVPSVAGRVAPRVGESEFPVESEEESQGRGEEGLASGQHLRQRPAQGKRTAGPPRTNGARQCSSSGSVPSHHGHRLANGLLAPLTS